MLKTAFVGNDNAFDRVMCEWLSEHSDLSLLVWTNKLAWAHGGKGRASRVRTRFFQRARRNGYLRAIDESLYYLVYRRLLQRRERAQIQEALKLTPRHPRKPLSEIPQVIPEDIKSQALLSQIESLKLDAMFSMCIDVYLPTRLINAPKCGSFLWHEGITPEYRGVYSPFWALVKKDYDRLGYTLLKMNKTLDAGEVFVQGNVKDIDPMKDWHSYIGHKAVLDSLPEVKRFLVELEEGRHKPISRPNAVDGYYSYPTLSSLLKIMVHRTSRRAASKSREGCSARVRAGSCGEEVTVG
jgi:hypothetical protein